MSDARRYAVWPEPRSRSRSLKGSRPSVPTGLIFFYSIYDVIDMMRLSMYRPRFVMFYPVLWTAIRNKRIKQTNKLPLFQDNLGKPVPKCLHSGFYWSNNDGRGGDNWKTYKTQNYRQQHTNTQLFTGRMHFLSPNQQCQALKGRWSHSTYFLTQSSPGGFPSASWPLKAPGYLGGGLLRFMSTLWRQISM